MDDESTQRGPQGPDRSTGRSDWRMDRGLDDIRGNRNNNPKDPNRDNKANYQRSSSRRARSEAPPRNRNNPHHRGDEGSPRGDRQGGRQFLTPQRPRSPYSGGPMRFEGYHHNGGLGGIDSSPDNGRRWRQRAGPYDRSGGPEVLSPGGRGDRYFRPGRDMMGGGYPGPYDPQGPPNNNHRRRRHYGRDANFRRMDDTSRRHLTPKEMATLDSEIEEDDDIFKVKYKQTYVLTCNKHTGEIILNTGGWRTISTLGVINSCLRPLSLVVSDDSTSGKVKVINDIGDVGTTTKLEASDAMTDGTPFMENLTLPGSLENDSWTVRAFNPTKKNELLTGPTPGTQAAEIQGFEDGKPLTIGSSVHNKLIEGRASIIKQYLEQLRLSLKARVRFGTNPPQVAEMPKGMFIETATATR